VGSLWYLRVLCSVQSGHANWRASKGRTKSIAICSSGYGQYEGRLTADIHSRRPGWQLFRDGCPGGETPNQVAARADRVIGRVRAIPGDVLIFSSGHFLRVLAAPAWGSKQQAEATSC
jgi:broad specificity phosphatase PhoE